jgi:Na+/melibiose symporter-like transporter
MSDQIPPQYPPAMNYAPGGPPRGASGVAIASLVLGIISIVLFCISYVSIPCAVLAIVLGALGRSKAASGEAGGKGVATAGIVMGVVAIALALLAIAGVMAFLGFMSKNAPALQKQLQQMQHDMEQQMKQQTMPASGPSAMLDPLIVYARAWLA